MVFKKIISTVVLSTSILAYSQINPVISGWLQNTTGILGRHYAAGNFTPINDIDSSNVQSVYYSLTNCYIRTKGIPAYISGPFLDGNPTIATNQNAIFRLPLVPAQNTGTLTSTTGGNIGLFINGVALFDYRDNVSWKNSTSALAGGPIGGMGDGIWNRDAVVGEKLGFDCAKGHPAGGNYHHHQNPSAFNLDLSIISTVCNLYLADGLYAIDSTQHSPLLGFAYDGFPIYGAYAYKNTNGTGGIVRMKSSWVLRNITVRNTLYTGATVTAGPAVSTNYPLGYFKEDYGFNTSTASDSLDIHNGRFCVTPEYPLGIYCYFATVKQNWNSAYPYVVGPTFYGIKNVAKVTTIPTGVTQYFSTLGLEFAEKSALNVSTYPNPATDIIAIQVNGLSKEDLLVMLYDINGKFIQKTTLYQGSTIAYFDVRTLYSGEYLVKIFNGKEVSTKKIIISK